MQMSRALWIEEMTYFFDTHTHTHTHVEKVEERGRAKSRILTALEVLPDWDPTASRALTTSMPSTTWPKTTCLPSSLEHVKLGFG